MSIDLWLAFAAFAMVTSVTPGPNNTLLIASGLNSGVVRTLPFLAGIQIGFNSMLVLAAIGLGQVFDRFPAVQTAMKLAGGALLVWFAWKLATAPTGNSAASAQSTLSFTEGALFQVLNPKAWIMCITAITVFLPADAGWTVLPLAVAIWIAIGTPCNLLWIGGGRMLSRIIDRPDVARRVNFAFAALLLVSMAPVLLAG